MSNLAKRITTAVVAAPVVLYIIYVGGMVFFGFVVMLTLLCSYELYTMVFPKMKAAELGLVLMSSFALMINLKFSYFSTTDFFLTWILIIILFELFRKSKEHLKFISVVSISVFYLTLTLYPLILLREKETGLVSISVLFLTVWATDIFAYFGGKILGNKVFSKKLFEVHSPKKTWEGYIIGAMCAGAVCYGFEYLLANKLSWHYFGIGLAIGVFSPFGDVAESMFKREAGVKDSSNLLPGHGGIFDRFDAFCFAVPIFWKLESLL